MHTEHQQNILLLVLRASLCFGSVASLATAGTITVDIGPAHEFISSISAVERTEQLRDWALWVALQDTSVKAATGNAFPSLRLDAVGDVMSARTGPYRWAAAATDHIVVVVPSEAPNLATLVGRAVDEYRADMRTPPRLVSVYRYKIPSDVGTDRNLQVEKQSAQPGQFYLTAEAGYFEMDIASIVTLRAFLAKNLDLVFVRRTPSGFRVGGRSHDEGTPRLMDANDIRTIFSANKDLPLRVRRELERKGLREIYYRKVTEGIAEILKKRDGAINEFEEITTLRAAIEAQFPYEVFLKKQIDAVMEISPPSLGFSLDPRMNFSAIAVDLDQAARGDMQFKKWLRDQYSRESARASAMMASELSELLGKLMIGGDAKTASKVGEESLNTLIGVTPPSKKAPAAAKSTSDLLDRFLTASEAGDKIDSLVDATVEALKGRSEVLTTIAASLRRRDTTALLDLEQYLEADVVGITIRRGSPKYRVKDLQAMLKESGLEIEADGAYGVKTEERVKEFQLGHDLKGSGQVDLETWMELLKEAPKVAEQLQYVEQVLSLLRRARNYQCARYDGAFQGTEVGMTLFYTDLVMKLWSFANSEQTPAVPGFVSETKFDIPKQHWDEIKKNPSTRGWLGARADALNVSDDSQDMYFAPIATKLYNASSSHLFPGREEVAANFMSQRFSSWWNNHYRQVADHEPQYHRLNQIMKWSGVQNVFAGQTSQLVTMIPAGLPGTIRFDQWWKTKKDLRVSWDVRFVRPQFETTECLELVQSDLFMGMGGAYSLSGGVSAFTDKDVAKAKARSGASGQLQGTATSVPGVRFEGVRAGQNFVEYELAGGNKLRLNSDGTASVSRPSSGKSGSARFRGSRSELGGTEVRSISSTEGGSIAQTLAVGKTELASVGLRRKGDSVAVEVKQSAHVRIAASLTSPSKDSPMMKLVGKDGKSYLRIPGSDGWAEVATVDGDKVVPPSAIRVSVRDEILDLTSRANLPAEALGSSSWAEASVRPFGGPWNITLRDSIPVGNKSFKLWLGGDSVEVQSDGTSFFVPISQGVDGFASCDLLASALDGRRAIDIHLAARDVAATHFVAPANQGRMAVASFGGSGGGEPPLPPTTLAGMFPPNGKGWRALLFTKELDRDQSALEVRGALLKVPSSPSSEAVAGTTKLAAIIGDRPSVGENLNKLPKITPADILELGVLSERRSQSYLEARSVTEKDLGDIVFVDLQNIDKDPRIMIRQGEQLKFLPISNIEEVEAARKLIDKAADQTAMDLPEFKEKTQPWMEVLEKIKTATGGRRFLLKEDGEVNSDVYYRLVGGEPGTQFRRDVPNVRQSLQNMNSQLSPPISSTVFVSTAGLEEQKNTGVQSRLKYLRNRLVPTRSPISVDEFDELLDDDETSQIVLVARVTDGRILFSDTSISLADLAQRFRSRAPSKDVLLLVTNGGAETSEAFAATNRFKRIILSRFRLGSLASFEGALDAVGRYIEALLAPRFTASTADIEELKGELGASDYALVERALKDAAGTEPESVEIVKLMNTVRPSVFERVRAWAAERARNRPNVDVDKAADAANELPVNKAMSGMLNMKMD